MKPALIDFARRLPRLYLPLLVMLCCVQTWRTLGGGDDFWAHAAIGRWIAENGQVPRHTLFLWGDHQPWIAHSWGTQLWFYGLMKFGGENGGPYLALAFACLMISLCLILLWREWARRGNITVMAALFFALGTTCAATRSRPRPELFSGLFFTILLIYLLNAGRREKVGPREVGIVAMFALWANLHGQVAAALLLLAVTAIVDLIQRVVEKQDLRPAWRLFALLIACAAAININPYGVEYWLALRPVGGAMFSHIDEWKPFWKWPALDPFFPAAGLLLAFFALLGWLGSENRRWSHGVWLLLWIGLFLSARRNLWMLSLVSLALLAVYAEAVSPKVFWRALGNAVLKGKGPEVISPAARALARWAMVIFLLVVVARQSPVVWLQRGPRAASRHLPVNAADKLLSLAEANPKLRVFNDYENSSYLQWRCGGNPPLFIDLLNAYRDQHLDDYFEIIKTTPEGKRFLQQRGINCVFLRSHKAKEQMAKLAKYLDNHKAWRRVYKDKENTASIWLKKPDL